MSYVEPGPLGNYSPEAHRASDGVRVHIVAMKAADNYTERWVAIRLSDGAVSAHAFPDKATCIRKHEHDGRRCLHELQCAYLFVPLDDFNPRAAELYLKVTRQMYDNGLRFTDPDQGNRELIMPLRGRAVFDPLPNLPAPRLN